MKELEDLFFELIQVALGKKVVLSKSPSEQEWGKLFEMARKQAVAGVAMAALEKLSEQGQKPPLEIIYEWIGLSEQIRQGNLRLNKYCKQLQRIFSEKGVRTSILKGQGIANYYDEGLRELRQSGDIDIYVDCGRENALQKVKGYGLEVKEWDYKHAQLDIWDDVAIEMHYRVEVMLNLWKNRILQRWFSKHREAIFGNDNGNLNLNDRSAQRDACQSKNVDLNVDVNTEGVVTPTVEFNLFYILLHIYRHFLYEGVGLRQIMDYYFVLKNFNVDLNDNPDLDLNSNRTRFAIDAIKEFGMERFGRGLMWVMKEVFAMPEEWMICEADEKEGRYILAQVMVGGNFGHHDQRLQHSSGKWNTVKQVCRHNWHLVSHYPADVIWAPVWFVWHKCWKMKAKASLSLQKDDL